MLTPDGHVLLTGHDLPLGGYFLDLYRLDGDVLVWSSLDGDVYPYPYTSYVIDAARALGYEPPVVLEDLLWEHRNREIHLRTSLQRASRLSGTLGVYVGGGQ